MPGATISALSKVLKDFYEPGINEQLNNQVLLTQRLEQRSDELFGNQAVVALHKARSGGYGARPDGGQLPDPGVQGYERATYDLKFLYGIVEVTGPARAKTRSEAGAWLEALRSELDGIRNDLANDLARQLYGDGTGVIAVAKAASNTNTIPLASAENIRKGFIHVGQRVDIGIPSDYSATASQRKIVAVNPNDTPDPTITIDGAPVTTQDDDVISISGSAENSNTVYEVSGLRQVVAASPTAFGGINPGSAGNEWWDNLRDTSSTTPSLDNLMKNFNQVEIAGGNVSAIITTYGVQRAFFQQLQQNVRFVDPMEYRTGFRTLEFMNRPFIADRHCPNGHLFMLDERFLKIYSNMGWHFLDDDGSVLKWKSGYDAWQAVLARYMNLGATRRNVQLVMTALTDQGF